ncbi:MAG: MFS transporter, partial [Crocinitomicaceae bacterium]|nr:MFS transporter [Crocinitomicaceae bacterium]
EKKGLLYEIKSRMIAKIANDRLVVIGVLAFFTIFFWMAFEQAGGSMTIFAKDFTDRVLEGSAASTFTVVNALLAIVPLAIISWVLILLFKATFKKYALANVFLGTSFVIIWGIVIWMVNKEMNMHAYQVQFTHEVVESHKDTLNLPKAMSEDELLAYMNENVELNNPVGIKGLSIVDEKQAKTSKDSVNYIVQLDYFMSKVDTASVREDVELAIGDEMYIVDVDGKGKYRYLSDDLHGEVDTKIKATVITEKENEVEVPASWFGVLNSLFIILFAPFFSKIWESKYNPSAPIKFAIGLILLGLGFGVLAFGASGIDPENPVAVSMIWLVLAYLLHTLGELALSPVGLSYVSKLSPPKLVGLMFGIWFTATAIANWLAGMTGSMIDKISEEYSLSAFFLIFTLLPILTGLILVALNKWLLKKMHGIK